MPPKTAAETAARAAARRKRAHSTQSRLLRTVGPVVVALLAIIIYFAYLRWTSPSSPDSLKGPGSNNSPLYKPLWKLDPIKEKGLGLTAAKPIPMGKMIMVEMPLVSLPSKMNQTDAPAFIYTQVKSLPPAQQKAFYSLTHIKSREGTTTGTTPEQDLAFNTFESNALRTGASTSVFTNAGRINHSDLPNADYFWREDLGAVMVHAIRDIKQGEEILIPYFDSAGYTKEQRANYLSAVHGIEENICEACPTDVAEVQKSEERRKKVFSLKEKISAWTKGDLDKDEALDALEVILQTLREEGYYASQSQYYAMGYQICASEEEKECAISWAEGAHARYVIETGEDSQQALAMKSVAQDPTISSVWGMKRKMAETMAQQQEDEIELE